MMKMVKRIGLLLFGVMFLACSSGAAPAPSMITAIDLILFGANIFPMENKTSIGSIGMVYIAYALAGNFSETVVPK